MQSSNSLLRLPISLGWRNFSVTSQCRCASLTSAIQRGIRTGKKGIESAEKRRFSRPSNSSYQQAVRSEEGSSTNYPSSGRFEEPRKRTFDRSLDFRGEKKPWERRSIEESPPYKSETRREFRSDPGQDRKLWHTERRTSDKTEDFARGSRRETEQGSISGNERKPWARKSDEDSSGYRRESAREFKPNFGERKPWQKERRTNAEPNTFQRENTRRDLRSSRTGGSGSTRETFFEQPEPSSGSPATDIRRARAHNPWEPGQLSTKPKGDFQSRYEQKREKVREQAQPDAGDADEFGEYVERRSFSRKSIQTNVPLSIPYTTAGSEFVYGTFAVKAALQSGRRKLYKLYVYAGEENKDQKPHEMSIRKLALSAGVRIVDVGSDWLPLLSKMTATRPHNGFILEASPIPKLPITALQSAKQTDDFFKVYLAHQSEEELAVNKCFAIHENEATIERTDTTRFPLVLMLDRILDPGNLGAIIRSAHFLGVDALIVVDHGTSPFSAVTVKASAGAAENFPVLVVKQEHKFIKASQVDGWKFFAATSPDSASSVFKSNSTDDSLRIAKVLKSHPCVLMLGNEGEGLRPALQRLADGFGSIANARGSEDGVDSLNVSVAAALLIRDFMRDLRHTKDVPEIVSSESADKPEDEALF